MNRLIESFRKVPSPSNRAKLEQYARKHMMAVCLLDAAQIEFLKVHGFTFVGGAK